MAGKPETPLHDEAVRRTGARRPIVVGDRLDTDIEGANNAGVPSLLVLTGVAGPADLVQARAGLRPTYVSTGLADGLLEPHPAVDRRTAPGRAAGWRVRRSTAAGGGLRVSGEGAPLDGLRAVSVAAWAGEPVSPDEAARVVDALGF